MDRFHFTTVPFTREIRVEQRLKAPHIEEQVMALKAAIDNRQSAVLIAPAGAGKTVCIRALLSSLPEARYKTSYLKLTDLCARDMCRQIARHIGAPSSAQYPTLVHSIEETLRSGLAEQGRRQVIVFDEAHEMREQWLRMLRLITNFDMDSKLVVSVVLCGQTPLKERLLGPEMEDIRQRLVHFGELRLLTREETRGYIEHRSRVAGSPKAPFDTHAVEALFELSRGNMRALDQLCSKALELCDKAERNIVDQADVAAARSTLWI
jgi:type II secretory pathway predicted ATPase ExeA